MSAVTPPYDVKAEILASATPENLSRVSNLGRELLTSIGRVRERLVQFLSRYPYEDNETLLRTIEPVIPMLEAALEWMWFPDRPELPTTSTNRQERFSAAWQAGQEHFRYVVENIFDKPLGPYPDLAQDRWAVRLATQAIWRRGFIEGSEGRVTLGRRTYASAHEAALDGGSLFCCDLVFGWLWEDSPEQWEDCARKFAADHAHCLYTGLSDVAARLEIEAAKLHGHLPGVAASADEPDAEEWLSPPLPLAELANRLGNISPDKARSILKAYGLKRAGNRQQWTVNLAPPMPKTTRDQLLGIRPPPRP